MGAMHFSQYLKRYLGVSHTPQQVSTFTALTLGFLKEINIGLVFPSSSGSEFI